MFDKHGTLYVVATPIGNLDDMSPRALACLQSVDLVAAEDTRVSKKLFTHYNIGTHMVSLHDHNEQESCQYLINKCLEGKSIALISDAGTPLINDPGFRLVQAAHQAGIPVSPIPGASSVIAALSVCGLPTDHFQFEGFLPAKEAGRIKVLTRLSTVSSTLIFLEAPHRILETLVDATAVLGEDRQACIAREITKHFEQISVGTLGGLLQKIKDKEIPERGEFVLLIAGAPESTEENPEVERLLNVLLKEVSVKCAASLVHEITGVKKNLCYEKALAMKADKE